MHNPPVEVETSNFLCWKCVSKCLPFSCSVHWSTGQPELDTGQTEVELPEVKSKNENCGRVCCPKCGSRGHWNKSKMLRVTGQCILFLIIASCGGLIINNNFGGDEHAPGIVDIVETTQLKVSTCFVSFSNKRALW